ncbi:hypothetical protein CUS_7948 [Ruminococcus albus 8]|uniref:Uncharacterized protein n=1 Tax=Ruminococcus albus 8 TaxID=246199 RepID=E9SAI7_RUMAL|nr:hypothetical protein CUS_7948 [Ruminococcus albus 8]
MHIKSSFVHSSPYYNTSPSVCKVGVCTKSPYFLAEILETDII